MLHRYPLRVTLFVLAHALGTFGAPATVLVPRITGKWIHVYQPAPDVFPGPDSKRFQTGVRYPDWQVNDHCILKGPDGRWHAFGITHPAVAPTEPDPHEAEWFSFHAVSPVGGLKLHAQPGAWTDQPKNPATGGAPG